MSFENSTVVQAAVTEEVVKVVMAAKNVNEKGALFLLCLLYTSPSPRD